MLGKINFNFITDLSKLPQKVATAMSEIESPALVGANYSPLMYVGDQLVRGKNYWFIAEQTLTTRDFEKHLVLIAVNEFENKFEIVPSSIIHIL